ncbi:MAG TPA: hypothetical protein VFQ44_18780 [Streptosporangiaceae bacterium]|nr:hypothetical protein [Streptosporangiaceae bacterium]
MTRHSGYGLESGLAERELAAGMRQRRNECKRIGSVFTHWVILLGPATRRFWGFPVFSVPRGTIVSAREPNELAGQMKAVERTARHELR